MSKVIIGIIVLILIVGGVYFFMVNNDEETTETTTNTAATTNTAPTEPATKITGKGFNDTIITIEPSEDKTISGIVTITMTNAPEETKAGFFAMVNKGEQVDTPNLGIDQDDSDGWSWILDTSEYENGVYEISSIAALDGDSSPLGNATAQVIIEN